MKSAQLSRKEIETVLRAEYRQRALDEREGEADESPSIIRELKATILLACQDRALAEHFFSLLEQEAERLDSLRIYQSGKESAERGEDAWTGLYLFLRELSLEPENCAFTAELQRVFMELTKQMPTEEMSARPQYLVEEYRRTYGTVSMMIESFFQMGYDAVAPADEKKCAK